VNISPEAARRAAVAVSDLLAALSPADVAELARLIPTGPATPAGHATAAALDLINTAGQTIPAGRVSYQRPADVPEWLRLAAVETLLLHHAGQVATCLHNPSPDGPKPIQAAAWRPGVVACLACSHLLRVAGPAAYRCDACGAHADPIQDLTLALGPLLYAVGLCGRCAR